MTFDENESENVNSGKAKYRIKGLENITRAETDFVESCIYMLFPASNVRNDPRKPEVIFAEMIREIVGNRVVEFSKIMSVLYAKVVTYCYVSVVMSSKSDDRI